MKTVYNGLFRLAAVFSVLAILMAQHSRAGIKDTIINAAESCADHLDGLIGRSSPIDKPDVQEAKKLCQESKKRLNGKVEEKDPCNEAVLKEKASKVETCTSIIYALAVPPCALECVYPITGVARVCQISGIIAMSLDAAGAIAVSKDAQTLMTNFSTMLPGITTTAGADFSKKERGPSCLAAIVNSMQSVVRYTNSESNASDAAQAYLNKVPLIGGKKFDLPSNAGDGVKDGGNGTAPTQFTPTANRTVTDKKANEVAQDIAQSFASAGLAPLLNRFDEISDRQGAALDMISKALSGIPPFVAASESLQGKVPDGTMATLASVQKESGKFKELLLGKPAANPIASFDGGSGGKRAAKNGGGGDDMDLAAMMAGLMPKAPGAKGAQGQPGLAVKRMPASTTEPTIHPPDQSIFDVIGTRYQFVQQKLLSGETVLSGKPIDAPSSLPTNLYLNK